MKSLLVGDPNKFALESCITHAFDRLGIRALGFFLIHIGGLSYGVRSPDATMLACSFDEVKRRLSQRGNHTAPFSQESDASLIAATVYNAIYASKPERGHCLNFAPENLKQLVYSEHLQWAPDGDEAFDDGSRVLHFDVGDRVRLISYKLIPGTETNFIPDPETLREQWIEADTFYSILENWSKSFEAEWRSAPKTAEGQICQTTA